jgi:hypothetical protein
MSLTINGATNTLTAASGLAIAGNTAITGTLSATGNTAVTGALSVTYVNNQTLSLVRASGGDQIKLGGNVAGGGGDIFAYNGGGTDFEPLNIGGEYVAVFARTGVLSAAEITRTTSTGLAVTGTLSASGITSVTDTTDATSTTAASLKTAGGLGVAKKTYCGGNIVMASGKGIDFSLAAGDAVGTAANVLDAYEEGTWTPVIGGLTTTSGQTYSTQSGRYTKVGNKVTLTAEMILTAKGTITGFSTIVGGFPFAVLDSPSAAVRFTGLGVNWISVILMPRATFTNAYLCGTKAAAAGVSLFADNGGDITDTTNIAFSFTYFTS